MNIPIKDLYPSAWSTKIVIYDQVKGNNEGILPK